MRKNMFYTMVLLLLLLVGVNLWAATKNGGSCIEGRYRLPNDLEIEIYLFEGKYVGKIVALNNFNDGQITDVKNPDKSDRKKPLIGKIIIEGLTYDATANNWMHGTMYAPEMGMKVNLKVNSVNESEAVAEGAKFLFHKTVHWKKVK